MQRRAMTWCGLAVVLSMATEVAGQEYRRRDPNDPTRATCAIPLAEVVSCDGVLKELKVTDEQRKELTKLTRPIDYRELGNLSPEQVDQMLAEMDRTRGNREVQEKSISKVLDEDQWKRLKEIHRQSMVALGAFAEPEIVKALELDREQTTKLRAKEWEMEPRIEASDPKVRRQKAAVRQKKCVAEFSGVLTREQKADWAKLTGKAFDVMLIDQPTETAANTSPNTAPSRPGPTPRRPAPSRPGAEPGRPAAIAATAEKQAEEEQPKAKPKQPEAKAKSQEYRVWTSTVGTKVEAAFTSMVPGTVKLTKRNGDIIKVPIELLSEADQKYIEELRKRRR